jgi:hypothetical protein
LREFRFDTIPYPWGFWVPNLAKFIGDDAKTTYEHIGLFLARANDVGITDVHKIRMFPLSPVITDVGLTRIMLSLADSRTMLTRTRKSTKCTSWRKRPTMRRAMRFL